MTDKTPEVDADAIRAADNAAGHTDPPARTRDEELVRIIGEHVGNATTCWEHLEAAGVFDSTRAASIVEALVADVFAHWGQRPPASR